jgi:hypothetical protein
MISKYTASSSRRSVLTGAVGAAAGVASAAAVFGVTTPASAGTASSTYLTPTGDTTGAQDLAAITAAFASSAAVTLGPGAFYINGAIDLGLNSWLAGSGMSATVINCVTAGQTGISITNSTGTYTAHQFAGVRDLSLAGPGGGNPTDGSIGLQAGDIVQMQFLNLACYNFNYGVSFINQYFWAEQMLGRLFLDGCTNSVTFRVASSGASTRTGSFDRAHLDIFISATQTTGTAGVTLESGAQIEGGHLGIFGNFGGSSAATGGSVLSVTGTAPTGPTGSSSLVNVDLEIDVEVDGSGGTTPTTVDFGSGNYVIASGYMRFDGFSPSNNDASLTFDGQIIGDPTLLAKVSPVGYVIFDAAPSGWTGNLSCVPLYDGNLVYLQGNLNLPSGAKLSSGTSLATIAAPFVPAVNKIVNLDLYQASSGTTTVIPCVITPAGNVYYNGSTAYTLTSTGSIQGSAVYSNGS